MKYPPATGEMTQGRAEAARHAPYVEVASSILAPAPIDTTDRRRRDRFRAVGRVSQRTTGAENHAPRDIYSSLR